MKKREHDAKSLPARTKIVTILAGTILLILSPAASHGQRHGQATPAGRGEEENGKRGETIATGIFHRPTGSFTGAARVVTRQELRAAGNTNILQSLKNIDPSLQLVEDLVNGSNPNALPTTRVRGQFGHPKMEKEYPPLFIVDGLEVNIERVIDMDMNRVETVTLLKDAAAKAIHGEKAAGGVIVIETRQPGERPLQVTYTGSLDLLSPDLTTLETNVTARPTRVATGQKHALRVEGGHKAFRGGTNLFANETTGVMKGSSRVTFTGDVSLSLRLKNLFLRDDLEITRGRANHSPWGSYSWYTRDEGDTTSDLPLAARNAIANTEDYTRTTRVTNNLLAGWNAFTGFTLTGRAGVTSTRYRARAIYPADLPSSGMLPGGLLAMSKGLYFAGDGTACLFSATVDARYTMNAGKHALLLLAGGNVNAGDYSYTTVTGQGTPGTDLDITGQETGNGRLKTIESATRELALLGAIDYSYDGRYLVNASSRRGDDPRFGRLSRRQHSWSIGAGWNLHRESFMEHLAGITLLKARASAGYTGTPTPDASDYSIAGVHEWNAGIDATLFNHRLSLHADYYVATTDDLLSDVALPSSTGFTSSVENLGKVQNTGMEFRVNYRAWDDPRRQGHVNLHASGTRNASKTVKLPDPVAPPGTITNDNSPSGTTGILGINASFKGLQLNAGVTYRVDEQLYSQTLVDMVESAGRSATRAVSRFIVKINTWTLSSVNLSYDLDRIQAISRAGFRRLRLSFDASDVARLSSVEIARGTAYPFARSFSLSLQATF
ncbi:MAG: TonB-dependent receptor plug domain-containing protein [Odoribacteraceae bacterium]|jgi:TonB-dependent SusC/RagA subfamily outer membrane receptor|nr:TonB-dependent receptor plug domain-containing protein [Odoribacteraceae bacterium]